MVSATFMVSASLIVTRDRFIVLKFTVSINGIILFFFFCIIATELFLLLFTIKIIKR